MKLDLWIYTYQTMNKTANWSKQRAKLKKIYEAKGITSCELGFEGCWRDNALSFAHRHKRYFYSTDPELLGEFEQTLLTCNSCHGQIEYDRSLTEEVFERLRGEE